MNTSICYWNMRDLDCKFFHQEINQTVQSANKIHCVYEKGKWINADIESKESSQLIKNLDKIIHGSKSFASTLRIKIFKQIINHLLKSRCLELQLTLNQKGRAAERRDLNLEDERTKLQLFRDLKSIMQKNPDNIIQFTQNSDRFLVVV